jgi:RNA recognition motif-containing protein
MNIYVGNLSYQVTEEDLRLAFEQFGQVNSATIIKDKFSGEPRGFGFVEMQAKGEAQSAIDGLNGTELKGRNLKVNEARPRPESHPDRGRQDRGRGEQTRGRGRWERGGQGRGGQDRGRTGHDRSRRRPGER